MKNTKKGQTGNLLLTYLGAFLFIAALGLFFAYGITDAVNENGRTTDDTTVVSSFQIANQTAGTINNMQSLYDNSSASSTVGIQTTPYYLYPSALIQTGKLMFSTANYGGSMLSSIGNYFHVPPSFVVLGICFLLVFLVVIVIRLGSPGF